MRNTALKLLTFIGGTAAAMAAHADAATDTAITTAMTEAGTSVALYGGGLVLLATIGVGFAVGIKYLKKIPRAA